MRRKLSASIATAVMLSAIACCPVVFAQGVPQTVQIAKVDVLKVANGYRASKFMDKSVVNDANETVGTVDDIIVSPTGGDAVAIVSVGGFLGMGTKLVAIPYGDIKVNGDKLTVPGATKDSLKALPEFKYASR
jgi:sporulation protein YlmC with PRC-barrel domain